LAKDVFMPALGMAQETGVLLQWLKAEGEVVTKGEPLMEVETDKATVEVEAPASGILANVTASPGDEIPVGQVIALILAAGEARQPAAVETASPRSTSDSGSPEVLASPLAARIAAEHNVDLRQIPTTGSRIQKEDVLAYLKTAETSVQTAPADNGRVLASPKARRLARENNLELASITGSGPEGAVIAADVLAAAELQAKAPTPAAAPSPTPAAAPRPIDAGEILPVSRMWQVMAQRLSESWRTVPHFYLTSEANATALIAWRERVLQRLTEKVTYTDLLVKLVAVALRKHPRLNAQWDVDQNAIILNPDINVGLAVAVSEGLLVPVIHRADQLGLADLAVRRKDLVSRAQSGKLPLADLSGGTFTLSNLGMYGIDSFNAIVNPPQAAILALGRIAERVVPLNGQPVIQPMLTLTLSCDHRVVDGARGAEFLQTLVKFIEDPLGLLD
jgi:pyruvate dehydrogenase E2 component (dihydrolipoamide acetyltransferase)